MMLTHRQKQYLWLMGSYPDKIAVQGRGYRTRELKYGVTDEELVLFGYSTPFYWMEKRGLVRRMHNANGYTLTEDGEKEFQRLLVSGAGLTLNALIRKVGVK